MPGRKRAAVTELFNYLENSDTKMPRVQCLLCQSSVVKNDTRLKTFIEQCLLCLKLLKQKFVDDSCKIINESDSEIFVENWLVNFFSENLQKKKQFSIINFADKITTQVRNVTLLLEQFMQAPRHSVWWKIHTGKAF